MHKIHTHTHTHTHGESHAHMHPLSLHFQNTHIHITHACATYNPHTHTHTHTLPYTSTTLTCTLLTHACTTCPPCTHMHAPLCLPRVYNVSHCRVMFYTYKYKILHCKKYWLSLVLNKINSIIKLITKIRESGSHILPTLRSLVLQTLSMLYLFTYYFHDLILSNLEIQLII